MSGQLTRKPIRVLDDAPPKRRVVRAGMGLLRFAATNDRSDNQRSGKELLEHGSISFQRAADMSV